MLRGGDVGRSMQVLLDTAFGTSPTVDRSRASCAFWLSSFYFRMDDTGKVEEGKGTPAVSSSGENTPSQEKNVAPDFNEQTNYVPVKTIITVSSRSIGLIHSISPMEELRYSSHVRASTCSH